VDQFYVANAALNLFTDERQRRRNPNSHEQWEADRGRRSDIRHEVELTYANPQDPETWNEINLQTEKIFKKEQWNSGKHPSEIERKKVFIYARAFLYALDSFEKLLNVLIKEPEVPSKLKEVHSRLGTEFPDLRGVRNSSQHLEDRSRGLGAGKNPKPLKLKAIDNRLIKSEVGVLALNNLNGTKYGNTMADGHYGEVDISPKSMEALNAILQDILDAFDWKGPKCHLPTQ